MLVRHAPTAATGRTFAADEPIREPAAVADALAGRLPADSQVLSSPKLRCRQTAEAAGLQPVIEPRLSECDFGCWEGTPFAAVTTDVTRGWLTDVDAAPHGGESLRAFATRITAWLDGVDLADPRPLVAVTHAGVIRAAVVYALGVSLVAFWRISVAPLSFVEIQRHDGGWAVAL